MKTITDFQFDTPQEFHECKDIEIDYWYKNLDNVNYEFVMEALGKTSEALLARLYFPFNINIMSAQDAFIRGMSSVYVLFDAKLKQGTRSDG